MVERIQKIARIKGVDYDVGKGFDSSKHQGGDKNSFAVELSKVMNKKTQPVATSKISDAYRLELSSMGADSLFYFGATDMKSLLN